MKAVKVISRNQLPIRLPFSQTILFCLALDYWKASELTVGVVLTLLSIVWIASLYVIMFVEKPVKLEELKE